MQLRESGIEQLAQTVELQQYSHGSDFRLAYEAFNQMVHSDEEEMNILTQLEMSGLTY